MDSITIEKFQLIFIIFSIPEYLFFFISIYRLIKNRYKGIFNRRMLVWSSFYSVKFTSSAFISMIYFTIPLLYYRLIGPISLIYFFNSLSWIFATFLSYFEFRRKINQNWLGLKGFWLFNSFAIIGKIVLFILKIDNFSRPNQTLLILFIVICLCNISSFILSLYKNSDVRQLQSKDLEIDIDFVNNLDNKINHSNNQAVISIEKDKWKNENLLTVEYSEFSEKKSKKRKLSLDDIKTHKKSIYYEDADNYSDVIKSNSDIIYVIDLVISEVKNRKFSITEKEEQKKPIKIKLSLNLETIHNKDYFDDEEHKLFNHTIIKGSEELIEFNKLIISNYSAQLKNINELDSLNKCNTLLKQWEELNSKHKLTLIQENLIKNNSSICLNLLTSLYSDLPVKYFSFLLHFFKFMNIKSEIYNFKHLTNEEDNFNKVILKNKKLMNNDLFEVNETKDLSFSMISKIDESKFNSESQLTEDYIQNTQHLVFIEYLTVILTNSNFYFTKIDKIKQVNKDNIILVSFYIKENQSLSYLKQIKKQKEINITLMLKNHISQSNKNKLDFYAIQKLTNFNNNLESFYSQIVDSTNNINYCSQGKNKKNLKLKSKLKRISIEFNKLIQDLFILNKVLLNELDLNFHLNLSITHFNFPYMSRFAELLIETNKGKTQVELDESKALMTKLYFYVNSKTKITIFNVQLIALKKEVNEDKKSIDSNSVSIRNSFKAYVLNPQKNIEIEVTFQRERRCMIYGKISETKVTVKIKDLNSILNELRQLDLKDINELIESMYQATLLIYLEVTNYLSNNSENSLNIKLTDIQEKEEHIIIQHLKTFSVLIQKFYQPSTFILWFSSELREILQVNTIFDCLFEDLSSENSSNSEYSKIKNLSGSSLRASENFNDVKSSDNEILNDLSRNSLLTNLLVKK